MKTKKVLIKNIDGKIVVVDNGEIINNEIGWIQLDKKFITYHDHMCDSEVGPLEEIHPALLEKLVDHTVDLYMKGDSPLLVYEMLVLKK